MENKPPAAPPPPERGRWWANPLRGLIRLLGILSGVSLMSMVGITTLDVVLRLFNHSLTGAYDLVKIAGAVTISAALPYTTAIKGHVAIEYFFHKLGRRGRVGVDTLMRLLDMTLFGLLGWQAIEYGLSLKHSGEVSLTLQMPVYWVPFVLASSCGLVVLITFYHMLNPGREMMKP